MKHNYAFKTLAFFLLALLAFSWNISAQATQPTPQALPFLQNFNGLDVASTTYPDGFQGWTASTSPGSSYNTSATIAADRVLVGSSTAATSSGNVHNYNGKIGFLNTGSLDLSIGLAIKTTGKSGIFVEYDAMVIRNPYNGTNNTRINDMILQYRVGTTDAFVNLLTTAYANTTTPQSAGTAEQNPQKIKIQLPADCDNKDIVQLRWISKQTSGGGARPSFAIDNISITNDTEAPKYADGFPKINNILSEGFDFATQLNENGKTFFVVLPAGSNAPSVAQIKAGTDSNNTAALKTGVLVIADPAVVYTAAVSGLTLGTSYNVYAVSEDTSGNLQAASTILNVTTSNVVVPSITTTINELNFSFVEQNTLSSILNYGIQGQNLTQAVTVTAPSEFSISKTESTGFQSSLSFEVSEFANNATPKVFVQFNPTTTGVKSGVITLATTGGSSKTVAVTGIGINPYTQDFNDINVLTNSGWTSYSVAGDKVKWSSTTSRFNSSPAAVQMNGFSENGPSKDWLISPAMRLNSFDKFPLLSFFSRKFFSGNTLKLMVSTNYDGKSNPETATWTALNGDFPTTTGTFKQSQFINLEAYKSNNTYVAWVYESGLNGATDSAEWTLDDVKITNEAAFIATIPTLNFGEIAPNTVSASQSFTFMAGGYGAITVTAPLYYQLSLDNTNFQNNVQVTAEQALAGITLYARFAPTTKELNSAGPLQLNGTGLNQQLGMLTASSLTKSETFDIVTYNLEFFGTDVKDTSGAEFGPTDDALQIDNVAKVMNTLNADVYAVQEVSDDAALETLITKINVNGKTFAKAVSPVWSRSFQPADPTFPPQKLVVLYNTQTTSVKKTRVMFSKLYDDVRAGTTTLPNYPSTGESFYSSGRLPYMVELETNIGGIKKDLKIVNLHARANSGTDITRYNMRKYDAELLKDSLDTQYPDANIILLGDYNDDVDVSVIAGNPSSYQKLVEDTARYNALTLDISKAGAFSFLSSGGFLDHILISNELNDEYIANSIQVYDPRPEITNYVNTTSDHGPVIARFELKADPTLGLSNPVTNSTAVNGYPNPVNDIFTVNVTSTESEKTSVQFYDLLGRKVGKSVVLKATSNGSSAAIDVAQLPTGIYIYTVTSGEKVIYTQKIIKR